MPYEKSRSCKDCLHHEVCACMNQDCTDFPMLLAGRCVYFRPKSQYIQVKWCDDDDWEVQE